MENKLNDDDYYCWGADNPTDITPSAPLGHNLYRGRDKYFEHKRL